jgi:hypothetical protein
MVDVTIFFTNGNIRTFSISREDYQELYESIKNGENIIVLYEEGIEVLLVRENICFVEALYE